MTVRSRETQNLRAFGRLQDAGVTYTRIMSLSDQSISTNGAGVIPAGGIVSSNTATLCADWASCQNLYSSFRVKRIKIEWLPAFMVNTTAVTVPALIYMVPFYGGVAPTTIPGFADSSGVRLQSGYRGGKMTVDYLTMDKDGDSHLWTPTNTTVPASEQFGISIMSTATASTVSTLVWKATYYLEVEFKITG